MMDFDHYFGKYLHAQSGMFYEQIVLEIITKIVDGKSDIEQHQGVDALLNYSIADLEPPVAVQIKKYLNTKSADKLIYSIANIEQKSLVVVCENVSPSLRSYLEKAASHFDIVVRLFSLQQLLVMAGLDNEDFRDIAEQVSKNRIASVLQSSAESTDWKKERQKRLDLLSECLRKNQLSLALGAGVSMSLGLPSWNDLLGNMFTEFYSDKMRRKAKTTKAELKKLLVHAKIFSESSPLVSSRLLHKALGESFDAKISKALYSGIRAQEVSPGEDGLLEAIANICVPPRSGVGVKCVLTYNFDDLLEEKLTLKGIGNQPIFRARDSEVPNLLPIYHAHGFIPRNANKYQDTEDALLVFSEEGYHQLYNEPFSWSNLIQLSVFRDTSTLMIGLSLADPSLRRLLDIAHKQSGFVKQYAFMKRKAHPKSGVHQETLADIIQIHHQLEEDALDDLGVVALWVEDYDEIPKLLNDIRKNAFDIN